MTNQRTSYAAHARLLALTAGSLVLACQERPPISYETEHLRVGTSFDEPLCQGDLDHMESVISTVEAELDVRMDERVKVYLWPITQWPPSSGICDTDVSIGCATRGKIYSSMVALDHELVHVVIANTLGWPKPFWSEGVAVALEPERTLFGLTAPVDGLDLERPDYRTAGHFSRYLLETYGAAKFRELLGRSGSARKAFERTYGMSAEDAQRDYFEDAPWSYAPLIGCQSESLAPDGAFVWSEEVEIDCGDAKTYGGPTGVRTYRNVVIAERGQYAISTTAENLLISQCPDENLALAISGEEPEFGDIPPVTSFIPTRYFRALSGDGEVTVLDLAPGRYELGVAFFDHDIYTAMIDVWAYEGPLPQVPEAGE